jgi:hypothetical protein
VVDSFGRATTSGGVDFMFSSFIEPSYVLHFSSIGDDAWAGGLSATVLRVLASYPWSAWLGVATSAFAQQELPVPH